jgi:hypothetical protein
MRTIDVIGSPRLRRRLARPSGIARLWLALGVGALLVAGPVRAQVPRSGTGAPDVAGGPWINSAPLTLPALRGRVVLVEFWTYG